MERMTSDVPPSRNELTAARAFLDQAIEAYQLAQARLQETACPVEMLERGRSETMARLSTQIRAIRAEHEAAIDRWLRNDGKGGIPVTPAELASLELNLTEMSDGHCGSEILLVSARAAFEAVAEQVRTTRIAVDTALWPATVEAVKPALLALEDAIRSVLHIEARVRAVVLALREEGRRDEEHRRGAFAAASEIEAAVLAARRLAAPSPTPESGKELLARLRLDPRATF